MVDVLRKTSLWLLLTMAVPFWGCGSSDDQPVSTSRTERSRPTTEVGGFVGAMTKRRGACDAAKTMVGSGAGTIDFEVRCSSSEADNVVFALWRDNPVRPGQRRAIVDYRRSPRVRGRETLSSHGRCDLEQKILTCSARINGPVTILGRFWAAPGTRCTASVSLVGITVPRCEPRACIGSPIRDELSRHRPNGCAI
jgi:hypothetical protein